MKKYLSLIALLVSPFTFLTAEIPKTKKQGIGKLIMNSLMNGEEKLCIHLTANFGNERFYQKLGFKKHKTAMAKYPYKSDYLED